MIIRTAVITRRNEKPDRDEVARYLPGNYAVLAVTADQVFISGTDNAGWTMDGYVIPRLASGMIFAKEITPG